MRFLTKSEVAEKLRVSVRTITEYNNKGILPRPKRIGRLLLWEEGELFERVMNSGENVVDTGQTPQPKRRGRPRKMCPIR